MKVTVCFDDIKVIVPCGSSMPQSNSFLHGYNFKMIDATTSENESSSMSTSSTCSSINSFAKMDKDTSQVTCNQVKVSSVIESSIARFKKATGKSQNCVVNILHLQTLRDGGILDPDDFIQDVVEDKELLIAIYEEINYDNLLLKTENTNDIAKANISNSLNNSSLSTTSSTSTNCSHSAAISSLTATTTNNGSFIISQSHKDNNINKSNHLFQKNQLNTSNCQNTFQIEHKSIDRGNNINIKKTDSSQKCMLTDNNKSSSNTTINSLNSNFLKMSTSTTTAQQQQQESTKQTQYFSRVNSNRQSSVRNNEWSTTSNNESQNSTPTSHINGATKVLTIVLDEYHGAPQTLGIHVVPTYDQSSQCDMGLLIQRIEPNARVATDGRIQQGDRIVEINGASLIGVDFTRAQELLREAIGHSNQFANGRLEFKLVRDGYNEEENERPIEADENMVYHDEQELQYAINKQNFLDPENKENNIEMFNSSSQHNNSSHGNNNTNSNNNGTNKTTDSSFLNNNPSSVNMSALNTKKLGKKVSVQLVKGPQGLGFKLAARDNCSQGEFSPIYIKNILPKGAAITDGRLQRGDRLLAVNQQDMTHKTLHEAVNILRNTKLGSCVEIVVSRQMTVQQNQGQMESTVEQSCNSQQETATATSSPTIFVSQLKQAPNSTEYSANGNNHNNNKRHMLTFEIALNDTGSAGLGVSVKGKTKRIEENDCSIDLGIFIKTVINGGAASKDGQLKANDQLININGYSLLGKSNEEAMLILREAMQVESRPGHIELTVSRKVKTTTPEHKLVASVSAETTIPEVKAIVKVIQHGAQQIEIEQTKQGPSRFSRDAPNRRSMSEKRTKIGHSQTSGAINKYNRTLMNDSSSDSQTSSIQPKRSKTSEPGMFLNATAAANLNSKTLHRNFKPSYSAKIGASELDSVTGKPIVMQQQNYGEVNSFKRIGSMDSAGNSRIRVAQNMAQQPQQRRLPNVSQRAFNQHQQHHPQRTPMYNDHPMRTNSVKLIPPISTISELYSSYDDESLNRHRLSRNNYFQLKSNSSTSLSSTSSSSSSFSPRHICRKKADLKNRNKSLGSVLDAVQKDPAKQKPAKKQSYMKSMRCMVMSCAKENDSTYNKRTIVNEPEVRTVEDLKKKKKQRSKSVSSNSSDCEQRYGLVDQANQFVSTDDNYEDNEDMNEFPRFQRRQQNARIHGSNVSSKIELLRHQQQVNQHQRLQQQQQQQKPLDIEPDYNQNRPNLHQARRSLSMESIPNTIQQQQQQQVTSSAQKTAQHDPLVQSYGPVVRAQQPVDLGFDGNEPVVTGNASQRFRSINRSFRTAVDKSFDMPAAGGFHKEMDRSENNNFKNRRNTNAEHADGKSTVDPISGEPSSIGEAGKQKLAHKKSLIETFQKLFKSGSKQKNPPASQHKSPVDPEMINGYQQKANTKDLYAQPITLRDNLSSQDQHQLQQRHSDANLVSKYQQFETMIDNNTLYTQYKPSSQQQQLNHQLQPIQSQNEPNLISTSSASSTSTASCSSSSSASSSLAQQQKPYFANRDCLFYHSTDNYRYNNNPQQSEQQKLFRDKQKAILEQQQQRQSQISRIQSNRASYHQPMNVKHSAPVNVSQHIRSVGDMFEETDTKTTYQPAAFNRNVRNAQSGVGSISQSQQQQNVNRQSFKSDTNTIIEDEYFHRNFKTNFTQNFHNTKLNFNLQNPIIVPHPAQV